MQRTLIEKILNNSKRHIIFIIIGFFLACAVSFVARGYKINPPETINSKFSRHDTKAYEDFLKEHKERRDMLVIGTSETAAGVDGLKYWQVMNLGKGTVFSLNGAGRVSYTMVPSIVKYPESFNGMKVIYYVNPVYWTKKLNVFHDTYFLRYVRFDLLDSIDEKQLPPDIRAIYLKYRNQIYKSQSSRLLFYRQMALDYIYGFWSGLMSNFQYYMENTKPNGWLPYKKSERLTGTEKEQELLAGYDKEANVPLAYVGKFTEGLGPISDSNFQYDALRDFIKLSKWANIDVTFVIGAFNYKLAEKFDLGQIEKYENVQNTLENIFKEENMPFIDARPLNQKLGAFKDQMHYSDDIGMEYMAKIIEDYYAKNEKNTK